MLFETDIPQESVLRRAITDAYRMDETTLVEALIEAAQMPNESLQRIKIQAKELITSVRAKRMKGSGLDAFLHQYDLSTDEGIALMCMAEALLRIPDKETVDSLIKDKIAMADWGNHMGKSGSTFVNAATWGLMLTGKIYSWEDVPQQRIEETMKRIIKRGGEPFIRKAVSYAMKILGKQFVMGRTINEALKRARELEKKGYRYSYDMLGEAARTVDDANAYFEAYHNAIQAIGKSAQGLGPIAGAGISIKLSALHPRYGFSQREKVLEEILPKLYELVLAAKEQDLGLTIDAEEADKLDLSLDIIENIFSDSALQGWEGFGLAVQSYQKRAMPLIDWLADLSKRNKRRIMIRLIKGAYWDTEIKLSQELGLESYPVFTRKNNTDVSFLACAKKILNYDSAFYPMFATHNANSVAAVLELVGKRRDFEFQCLHGMGQSLYDEIVGKDKMNHPCRIYAPVGCHEDLLAYLVRRLLENGANTSFVNRIVDADQPLESLVMDYVAKVEQYAQKPHPKIPLPMNIYGESRKNSRGLDLTNWQSLSGLQRQMQQEAKETWQAGPIIKGTMRTDKPEPVKCPFDNQQIIGHVIRATEEEVETALQLAARAETTWGSTAVVVRAQCLENMADLLEQHRSSLMTILIKEAGKTIDDALSEVREAIDFCRYYAMQAKEHLAEPLTMPGPTGELNQLYLYGRGVIACISPWNFPLAIFLGQISAALAAGNPVLTKPSAQTPLIAATAVKLFHQAGIPTDVLQLLPGSGAVVGAKLVADTRVKGVMFTGSTETARGINQSLANRDGPIVPFIAETGGQNAMIVDSTTLPEQAVVDIIKSAFGSAGQRCSALRVLFVQDVVADKLIKMLRGAMAEITLGNPSLLRTDVGPVIDANAKKTLDAHLDFLKDNGKLIYQVESNKQHEQGTFVAPTAYEIASLSLLEREVFGPILHVIRYKGSELDKVIDAINETGYGLTLGILSRIESRVDYIAQRVKVGNAYVNRNMIGAVVGVQPFGGEGLSGTGPKAGGPHYLMRLCTERTVSINTTAAGGNASLMSLCDDE